MSFFTSRAKPGNPAKTEDAQYDEVATLLQTILIQPSELREPLLSLIKNLQQLSGTFVKFSKDLDGWLAEGNQQEHPSLGGASRDLGQYVSVFDSQTVPFFASRLAPNFFEALEKYESTTAQVAKLKDKRTKAVAEFDRCRNLLRQAETAKKPKQSDIDKARQKCEEANIRYQQSNAEFQAAVQEIASARPTTIGNPFKRLCAIFIQYMRMITPSPAQQRSEATAPSAPKRAAGPVEALPVKSSAQSRLVIEEPVKRVSPLEESSKMKATVSFGRIDDLDFNRGGWAEAGITFAPPPLPPPKVADGNEFVNPFEDDNTAAWDAQLAAAKLTDPFEDLGDDNPFK
jgi:hypothetical protein